MRTLLKKLETAFPSVVHVKNFGRSEQLLIEVGADQLIEIAAWLRMEESFRMDFLENSSIYEMKGKFTISYFLRSYSQDHQLVLRTSVVAPSGNEEIEFPSVTGIWPQAEAFENEQAALFGVRFTGKTAISRVKRNLGPFEGFPLRKSFEWGEQVDF